MKKWILPLLCIAATFPALMAQNALVLTAVFDGPLSGGLPKGIELYVLEDIADLSVYGVGSANNGNGSDGVEYNFPAVSAAEGEYLYLTHNEAASFTAFFGFEPDFVDDIGGSVNINGDDAIELFFNGEVVDIFGETIQDGTGQPWEYLDGWAYRVNGTGPDGNTFVLSNWAFSGINALDNETTNNTAAVPVPIGTYNPAGTAVISANNDVATTDANTPVIIDVLANDQIPNALNTLSISQSPANGGVVVNMDNTLTYTPDPDFCGSDAFDYEICDDDGCSTATVTVNITCPTDYPAYAIGQVNTVDAEGVGDSIGVTCALQGIVYGVNLRPSGLQFTIIDPQGDGIGVFNSNMNFGYTVQEGDEVRVEGVIEQFNGLLQMALDDVTLLSTGNSLLDPAIVTQLGENTESQLVRIENVTLVDPAQWDGSGGGFNVEVTDGSNTITVRIDNDVDIFNLPPPTGTFSVTGIGGQFDNSLPYTEGYQLLPRYMEDIDPYNTGGQDDYPPYPVGIVTTNDAEGAADSLGVQCELTGIVYGVNLRPNGLEFTLIDSNNDGIGVFNPGDNLGYAVTEGDEITVRGTIDQFNGLTQIAAEEIDLLSSGNALATATVVTELNEETESQFILLDDFFTLADPSQWDDSGGSFNFTITNGTDTYQARVDSDTEIAGTPAPTLPFRLFGIGSQFDPSAPYDEGYQIIPRYLADFDFGLSNANLRPEGWEVYPNPVVSELFVKNPDGFDLVWLTDSNGKVLSQWRRPGTPLRIDMTYLPAGLFYLTLRQGEVQWSTPIVKQ